MLFITLGIQAVATFVQVFSPSWVVFCLLNFTVGLGQISNYLTAFVLGAARLQSPSHRPEVPFRCGD